MNKWVGLIATIALSYFIVKPLFFPGYFPMHDDTQVARVVVMGKALRQGQFPVRWVSDLGYGYGYPIYNFYGPLPYYFGGSLFAMGADSVTATKAMFAAGALAAAVFFYLFFSTVFDPVVSIAGSLLFVYAPYHAVQMYVRGAVGEYWAIAFIPLLIWGLFRLFKKEHMYFGVVVGAVGLAGVNLSHTILGFITSGITIVAMLCFLLIGVMRKKVTKRILLYYPALLLLGLGLSAFFWIPAYGEMSATSVAAMIKTAPTGFFDHFVCPNQLWDSPWGFGGSAPGCVDGMSFKLGKLQLVLSVIGMLLWFIRSKRIKTDKAGGIMVASIVLFVFSVLAVTEITKSLWSLVPFVSFIQYPWRLLTFTAFAMGISGAYVMTSIPKQYLRYAAGALIIAVCLFMNAKLFRPQYLYAGDSKVFESTEDLRWRVSKVSDEYLPSGIIKPTIAADIVRTPVEGSPSLEVSVLRDTDTFLEVEVESDADQTVTLRRAYFPGWIYTINGKEVNPSIARGLPHMVVLKGKSVLTARLTNTPVRELGNIVSIISVIVLGGIIIYGKKTVS